VLYTIYFSGPLFIIIIDYTYFKNTISKQQTVGVALTGAGVLLTANGQALWARLMGNG
jgi:drug/metabolite transporter (DMT)-like permease